MNSTRARTTVRWICMTTVALVVAAPLMAADRKLGTIGPPPRKNPQRQTSAEAFPPLPLPVTPMRRSEPKAEPQAPLFAGKLTYGETQDYMPNPGDLDNLMRHVRYQLGLWYSQRLVSMDEVVSGFKSGKPVRIPMLYVTGYEAFSFTDEQRAALRDYVVSGGTLLGDATLGSEPFAESFRAEVKKMFPKRELYVLPVDHPVFRAYYPYKTVHYFKVKGGVENQFQSPPKFLGMNIGTRTAIILSPYDMTCGWDEFYAPPASVKVPDAPRTMAMMPGDAIRMGMNIVSYTAALRQVGQVEAVTREIRAPKVRPRQQLTFAQLQHHGDWNPDPNSVYQLLRHVAIESSLAVGFDIKYVNPDEREIAEHPFLFMTGFRDPRLSDEQVAALRNHLQAGGFLLINNCSGYSSFDQAVRAMVQRMFPDQEMAAISAEHPLMSSFFSLQQARDRLTGAPRPIELEGITVRDRLVLVYSKNDMVSHLKQVSDPYGNGYDASSCRQLALNVVAYSLQN